MEADINMKSGYYVNNVVFSKKHEDTMILVGNLDCFNEVLNYPDNSLTTKFSSDIGVWKIKKLKN